MHLHTVLTGHTGLEEHTVHTVHTVYTIRVSRARPMAKVAVQNIRGGGAPGQRFRRGGMKERKIGIRLYPDLQISMHTYMRAV